MFKHTISQTLFTDVAIAPVAAGTGDTQAGITIDTAGYEAILFGVYLGTITASAVTTIKVQAGDAANGSDMADISGASVSVPDTGDDKLWLATEIYRPTKRYLRVAVVRSTANVVINGGFVLMGRSAIQPAPQGANAGNVTPTVLVSVP